jgi:hypothetical protein
MHEAAFNRALDQILGVTRPAGAAAEKPSASRRRPKPAGAQTRERVQHDEPSVVQQLISRINRTDYPEVFQASHVLDRALRVLRLAEENFDTQWLSAPEIAEILKEKFRLPTTHQAVRQALDRVPQYIDTQQIRRGSQGRSVTAYRVMTPGITFLDSGGSGTDAAPEGRTRHRRAGKPAKGTRARRSSSGQSSGTGTQSPATGRSGRKSTPKTSTQKGTRKVRPGPKQSLTELLTDGFFDKPRTIRQAQEQLRHKKGLTFTLQDLSPSLVRMLREGSLDREQNESGQYEYQRA